MDHKVEWDQQCESCGGTGIYDGLAERDGSGVVCYRCKGTGKVHVVHEYNDFTGRKPVSGITLVLEANPGVVIGNNPDMSCTLSDFGGMPYSDWDEGKPFPKGSEMRRFTCPAWWYQSADYSKKPHWDECGFGLFSACKMFPDKNLCWEKFDIEATP